MNEIPKNIIQFENIDKIDLSTILFKEREVSIAINDKQARRLQHDWDKFGNYKLAYVNGQSKKGLWLSFLWMLTNIATTFRFGKLDRLANLYYTYYQHILPVDFTDSESNNCLVTFRIK